MVRARDRYNEHVCHRSNESFVWQHNVHVHEFRYDPSNVSDKIRSCASITTFSVYTVIAPIRYMCLYDDDVYTLGVPY